jgi:hypothetical protein
VPEGLIASDKMVSCLLIICTYFSLLAIKANITLYVDKKEIISLKNNNYFYFE